MLALLLCAVGLHCYCVLYAVHMSDHVSAHSNPVLLPLWLLRLEEEACGVPVLLSVKCHARVWASWLTRMSCFKLRVGLARTVYTHRI